MAEHICSVLWGKRGHNTWAKWNFEYQWSLKRDDENQSLVIISIVRQLSAANALQSPRGQRGHRRERGVTLDTNREQLLTRRKGNGRVK